MRVSSSRIGWTSRGSYMGAFRPGMVLSLSVSLHSNIIVRPHASADSRRRSRAGRLAARRPARAAHRSDPGPDLRRRRSEEHTSELQSRLHLVCRLLLEKKKKKTKTENICINTN